jgi:glycosyltransferase involved in cell wall biosynthesis
MHRTIYVDLRCLQDRNYRVRGIGQHLSALLRARKQSDFASTRTVGLVEKRSPALPAECAALVDEVSASLNPCSNGAPAIFIDGTPMTHDTRFGLRFVGNPAFLTAAVVYDFIPLDWPGYLPSVARRIDYLAKLARLRSFDCFFPISGYTAWRLAELLGASQHRIHNTGASVRRSIYELRDRPGFQPNPRADPYFLAVQYDDPRKNPQVIIEALRQLNLIYSRRIALKVVGHYASAYKRDLLKLAGQEEGDTFLEFRPDVSDEELVSLYRGATATVVSSHVEGFSLPVVEASVCGCPVIASTCAAHLELIDQPAALFPSNDGVALAERLDALLKSPPLRASLVSSQAHLGSKFHEAAVGQRFWDGIQAAAAATRSHGPSFTKQQIKPRLAFLSPYPPDGSEAAFYTAMTMEAGKKLFHSDLYTSTTPPLLFQEKFRDAGTISLAPLCNDKYSGILSVLGNSSSYSQIFDFFDRFGGPCILHDVRLTQAYFQRLGMQGFLSFASGLLGRPVSTEDANPWLQDVSPPSLFAEHIIERASPLIVHSLTQQALLKQRYGVDAQVATSCPSIMFADEDLTAQARQSARERLGIPSGVFAISGFGNAAQSKGMDVCVVAVDFLRSWNIPAELYFPGELGSERTEIDRISSIYGVAEHVHSGAGGSAAASRDFLMASDAAVQLRSYEFGKPSTLLSDCISAALPCVATSDMAVACDAPSYVAPVPDRYSPLHVAEQLAPIWESQRDRAALQEERIAYIKTHNFSYYGSRLMEILGVV